MPAHECQVFPVSYQVSLYVNLSCYMSNCYISVYMPSALFHMLYPECYVQYAKLRMLDCNMPNAMTIAMSFSMTTEQVGHLIIYTYIYYPAMTLHIVVTEKKLLLYHHGFNLYLRSHVFQFVKHIRVSSNILSYIYFSMPTYLGINQNLSMPTYHGINQNLQSLFISVRQHIKASVSNSYHHLFWYASISRHYIITSVIANSGSIIYRDINLKANKYHISYYIQSHRVSRFDILEYLVI
jgi:hypothetical protein